MTSTNKVTLSNTLKVVGLAALLLTMGLSISMVLHVLGETGEVPAALETTEKTVQPAANKGGSDVTAALLGAEDLTTDSSDPEAGAKAVEPPPAKRTPPPEANCTLYGNGNGRCIFSNLDAANASAVCGVVELTSVCKHPGTCDTFDSLMAFAKMLDKEYRTEAERSKYMRSLTVATSGAVCSGKVPPLDSVEVNFYIGNMEKWCIHPLVDLYKKTGVEVKEWWLICPFEFIPSEPNQ